MSGKQLVGEFIDAAVHERSKALSLLAAHPELRSATWLGEPLLQFLAVRTGASIGPLGELESLVEMLCTDEAARARVLSVLQKHRG
ncbi:MAG: hypothetical protein Q8N23_31355 [Archangium sp.]|nr:hypothetical protein [Archangium sp.]MDP3576277.1 hypothetical protein [Archangium sp.]